MSNQETRTKPEKRRRGSRALRIAAVAALAVVILLAAAALLVPYLVPMEGARGRIVAELEAVLGRPVEVGEVSLRILPVPSVALHDIRVHNPEGWETTELATVEEVSLELALWPLLRRRAEVDGVVVSRPEVFVVRRADGRSNLEGLFPEREEPPSSWDVEVGTADVNGAELTFEDHAVTAGEAVVTRIRALNGEAEGLLGDAPVDLRAKGIFLEGGAPNVQLEVRASREGGVLSELEGRLLVQRLDPSPLAPYAGEPALLLEEVSSELRLSGRPGDQVTVSGWVEAAAIRAEIEGAVTGLTGTPSLKLEVVTDETSLQGLAARLDRADLDLTGRGALEATLQGPLDALRAEGVVRLADLRAEAVPTALEPVDAAVGFEGGVPGRISVDGWVDAAGARALVSGHVDGAPEATRLDLRVTAEGVPVSRVLAFVPEAAVPPVREASGRVDLTAQVQGTPSEPAVQARVVVRDLAIRAGAADDTGQGFRMDGATLTADADLRGRVPKVDFDLDAQVLELGAAPGTGGEGSSEPPELTLDGNVRVSRGRFMGFTFRNLQARVALSGGRLLVVPSLSAYGGRLSGRLATSLGQALPASELELDVESLSAGEVAGAFSAEAGQALAGALSGRLAVTFDGFAWEQVRESLAGRGQVRLEGAEVAGLALLPNLARQLTGVASGFGLRVPQVLEARSLRTLTAGLQIQGGQVRTPDLVWAGQGVRALAEGAFTLEGRMAYEGTLELEPAVAAQLGMVGRALGGAGDGSVAIPFTVTGSVGSPQVALDQEALATRIRAGIAGEAQRRATDALGDVLTRPAEEGDDTGEEAPRESAEEELRRRGEEKARDVIEGLIGG